MAEDQAIAFWSYARIDDERDLGRIVRLAELVAMEYGLITGMEIRIFVDRNDLQWGELWRERIEEALQTTTFFIPIVTPTYFQREECRKELWKFHSAAQSLGVGELIMPIVYQCVANFSDDNPNDAIALVAAMHVEFFDEVRLEDEGSAAHRQAVHRLAARLAQLTEQVSARPAVVPGADVVEAIEAAILAAEQPDDSDAPGTMDLLAALEPDMQEWTDVMNEFPPIMDRINVEVVAQTERLNEPQNASFPRRVLVARDLAAALEEPAGDLEHFAERYVGLVQRVDPGVWAMLEMIRSSSKPDAAQEAAPVVEAIVAMAGASRDAVAKMREFVATTKATQKMSRDLRPVLGRINTAVMNIVDAQSIIDGWEEGARSAAS